MRDKIKKFLDEFEEPEPIFTKRMIRGYKPLPKNLIKWR
jgi:hypothetical protein